MSHVPTLERWGAATWKSLQAAMYAETCLPADSIGARFEPGTRRVFTSPSNIAGLMWSAVAARELGVIGADECSEVCAGTLRTLAGLERHDPSGLFYNWYSAETTRVERTGRQRRGSAFVSAVDNGWLAMALALLEPAVPEVAGPARQVLASMNFLACYDDSRQLFWGGFWDRRHPAKSVPARPLADGPVVHVTRHHYELLNSEPRIAVYLGYLLGQLPEAALTALAAPVVTYRGRQIVATLGGSMFEALSPDMFIAEELWAPGTWGRNHATTVALQREFGLEDRGYPVWGHSPCAKPGGGYGEFGASPLGLHGYPAEYRGSGLVTAHASVMALQYEPAAAVDNLRRLEGLGCWGPGGFLDSVAVRTQRCADRYLTIDQAFVMAALVNEARGDVMRRLFSRAPGVETRLRPLVTAQSFPSIPDRTP